MSDNTNASNTFENGPCIAKNIEQHETSVDNPSSGNKPAASDNTVKQNGPAESELQKAVRTSSKSAEEMLRIIFGIPKDK